jgi:DNA helicase-2/ATP-dependent DNA helicase PcrA
LGEDRDSPLQKNFASRAHQNLSHFGALLNKWIILKEQLTPLELMDTIIGDVDYQEYIDDGSDEGRDRWENVQELRRLAYEYQDSSLEIFLERVALVSDQDTLESTISVPTLLTLHAAKGLEFAIVMIAGLNEGTLPHSRSFDDEEEMLEERRLFYVGITRAKDQLYLIHPQNKTSFGYPEPVLPSRFLDDIPSDLLDITRSSQAYPGLRSSNKYHSTIWGEAETREVPYDKKYEPGQRVQHPEWGEGMVLNSRIEGSDEIVDIFFEAVGLKRVVASMAQLVIIE